MRHPLAILPLVPALLLAGTSPVRLSPLPLKVEGCATTTLDLGGTWKFHPAPPPDFARRVPKGWADIRVPGEWAMQGVEVKPGTAAAYVRTFTLPGDWRGKRVKLLCDAVYSDAVIWVNGTEAGRHSGGFTPFEVDITALVKASGSNTLAISVLNESVADRLASGSQYACHQLGGIPRGIRLAVFPEPHLSGLAVTTRFDAAYRNATLELDLALEAGALARIGLVGPDGRAVPLPKGPVGPGKVTFPVAEPAQWDNEHPNLYTLTLDVESKGRRVATVRRKVGFRQVEVRGNALFVNGRPVKLRGVNRHEVHPTQGRSLPKGLHRRDVELFREGNVNLIRTSHYPPDLALAEAADELGMFLEVEAPFCWSPGKGHEALVTRQTAEMVVAFRNHPSVLFWSLANESEWGPHFEAASRTVRELDPTRPQTFNWMTGTLQSADEGFTEIANIHYPGHSGADQALTYSKRPVYLGEDCHLNAYNRLELATDPALRDLWGRSVRKLWDHLLATPGALGQSIWAGIDDTFYLKHDFTAGYGTWGPLDGWRRTKPEWWGMKKAYSPVRLVHPEAVSLDGGKVTLQVENRQNFADLRDIHITWRAGAWSGTAVAAAAPGQVGALAISLGGTPPAGTRLELSFRDPRGHLADQFSLPLVPIQALPAPVASQARLEEGADAFTVVDGRTTWKLHRRNGQFLSMNELAIGGPSLMLLPLNSAGETQMEGRTKVWTPFTQPCQGWACSKVEARQEGDAVVIRIEGRYDEAEGTCTLTFQHGGVVAAYDFKVTKALNPRQTGLVLTLPRSCDRLTWERNGGIDTYPEDHIARLKGSVRASEGFEATSVGPRTPPSHPWRLDRLPYGNNDFCSTKHAFLTASLQDAQGRGLLFDGGGSQHIRSWQTEQSVNVLIADYSNGGSERFLRKLVKAEDRPLAAGSMVQGKVRFRPASSIGGAQ